MPVTLRSGLTLLLAGDAPFDPGKNWFKCPPGHFWLKVAAPEMGAPLFDPTKQVWEAYEHAPVPRNRSEAAKFARIYEMRDDGSAVWRGEWLFDFPKYRNLSTEDLADWENWANSAGAERFLDEIIELCGRYAHNSQDAIGYFLTPGPVLQKAQESTITKDVEIFERCRLAAEQGDADAQFNLGFRYGKGQGVPQDYAEAIKWIGRARKPGPCRGAVRLRPFICGWAWRATEPCGGGKLVSACCEKRPR